MLSKIKQKWILIMLRLSNAWKKKIKDLIFGIIIIIFEAEVTSEVGVVTSEEGFSPE